MRGNVSFNPGFPLSSLGSKTGVKGSPELLEEGNILTGPGPVLLVVKFSQLLVL